MDAVELPLQADVVVSKILASDGASSILGGAKGSGCSPFGRDMKLSATISECSSVSRNKNTDAELRSHQNILPNFKCQENGRRHHLEEADRQIPVFHNHESKLLNRKSTKRLSNFPCFKRRRRDQPENSVVAAGADDHDAMPNNIGYDLIRCTSAEKVRMLKQKRVQDGRTDKRNCRASLKTKYDSFTSKGGLIISDSVSGGNDILGLYGLKTDLHDVTKHVEDLSINELLDGTSSYRNLCPEKGKASNTNENILQSFRKAFSVLPPHGAVNSIDNRKAFMGTLNSTSFSSNMPYCEEKGNCTKELPNKVQSPCQENWNCSTLYQPKDILDRLALSPAQDLEALILNSSMSSVPSQSTLHIKGFCGASLPPFPWSFSHGVFCKPGTDSGKVASMRNTCQCKWVRIGSSPASAVEDHCFLDLELNTLDNNANSIKEQKIDNLLKNVEAATESVSPLFNIPHSISYARKAVSEVHTSDSSNSIKRFGSGSFVPRQLKLEEKHADISNTHIEYDSKDMFLRSFESDVSLRHQGSDLKLVDASNFNLRFKESEVGQNGLQTGAADGSYERCHSYSYKGFAGRCEERSWNLPTLEISKPGCSPRLLAAAEILYEMASCSNAIRRKDTIRKIKWPKEPSQKTMKARKSMSSIEKTDRLFLGARHHDPIERSGGLPFVRNEVTCEKKIDFAHLNNTGREPVRWSFSPESAGASGKLERDHDLTKNKRSLHGNSVRPFGQMLSVTKVEMDYDNQQKLKRATLKMSPFAFEGAYIKDWSRGKSKRM